jgi:hypothetical protein
MPGQNFVIFFASRAGLCYNMALSPGVPYSAFLHDPEIWATYAPDRYHPVFLHAMIGFADISSPYA